MQSVLHKACSEMVETRPFPHIVIQNALDEDIYQRLARDFPSFEILIDGRDQRSNDYLHYSANKILADPRVSPSWREFTAYHTSNMFFREVAAVFGSHMRRLNGRLEGARARRIEDWETHIRFKEALQDSRLECPLT